MRNEAYLMRQNIYAIDNERVHIGYYDYREMIHQLRQLRSRTRSAISNSNSNIQNNEEMKALKHIFKNWRRGNSLISDLQDRTCSICLGGFEKDQVLIQLKWNHSHWFHYQWIRSWATKNDTWPIWRANYVEAAHKECQRSYLIDRSSSHSISFEDSI